MEQDNQELIFDLQAEAVKLRAEIETLKAQKSLVECVREAYSKDIIKPKVLQRRVRYKKVDGKKEAFTEVTITEAELNYLISMATNRAFVEEKITELKKLGDQLWHKLNQTELYKTALELETRNKILQANYKSLEKQLYEMREQELQEPYVYYEDEIIDLEIE
jgi:hypothetical protein